MNKITPKDLLRVFGVIAVIIGIGAVHYFTPDSMVQLHYLIQRLFYVPVVYAGLYFGWRGGLSGAVFAGLAYLPQILATWKLHPSYSVNQCAEVVLFCVAGVVAGLLADRERGQKKILQVTAEQLSRVYGELQDNFERMKRAERLYALGQLSAGLAHEIRNPLASIEGATAVLLREPPSEERRIEFLQIIQKETRRLNRLLTNFLNFAKPREPEFASIHVAQILDSVIALAEHAIHGNPIVFRKEVADNVTELECDSEQLTQILLNLTINAIQAMPAGGEIVLSAHRRNGNAVIEVQDQGTGISEKDLEKIFDPFFTTKESGTGMGLPVAHQIAARQGGVLSATRNTDQGMTFSLEIPLLHERLEE
jgi:two-component system, NtrC family, sensor histidine kinase HydH